MNFKPSPCVECGYDPALHAFERWSLILDQVTEPILRPLSFLQTTLSPITSRVIDRIAPATALVLANLRLGTLRYEPDTQDPESARYLWKEAQRRGITMYQFCPLGLRRRLFLARYQGGTCAFEGLPRPNRRIASLAWVDNKIELKKRFRQAGFPVARGGSARHLNQAIELFHGLSEPVITKPHIGSGGRHTTLHIKNDKDLASAFQNAKQLSPRVVIEEQLDGPVIRATLIGGKLVAVLRRDPPQVIGDGVRTVRELVEEINQHPLRAGPEFAKVPFENVLVLRELFRQNLTWESIPEHGRRVFLHFKVNWGIGGTSEDVTDIVHPDNQKLFEDIAQFLDDDIVGIDFIISDITRSWRTTERCGVIECNSLPHIANHHIPFTGTPRNVAAAVWDLVFPK